MELLLHYLLSPYYITFCLLTALLTVAGYVDDGDADGARRNPAHPPPTPEPPSHVIYHSLELLASYYLSN